jgi:hypothetical protein
MRSSSGYIQLGKQGICLACIFGEKHENYDPEDEEKWMSKLSRMVEAEQNSLGDVSVVKYSIESPAVLLT